MLLSFSQGGKAGAVQKCVACRGRGMRVMIRQLAPGMVQQMQSVCTDCNGEGAALTGLIQLLPKDLMQWMNASTALVCR